MYKQITITVAGIAVLLGTTISPVVAASNSARIIQALGQVQAKTGGRWHAAGANFGLAGGTSVRTGQRSRAVIQYNNGSVTRMGAHTLVRIQNQNNINLLTGKTWVNKKKGTQQLKVRTPTAVAAVMGTTLFVSHNQENISHVTTLDGVVEVTNNQGEKAIVNPGEWVEIEPGKPMEKPTKFDWEALKRQERFLLDLDFVPTENDPLPEDDWR